MPSIGHPPHRVAPDVPPGGLAAKLSAPRAPGSEGPVGWRRARFKGQEVWARVDGAGNLAEDGGRVEVRYQARSGAKVYRAGAARVELIDGAPTETLDDGVPVPDAQRSGGSAAGTGRGSAERAGKAGTPGGFGKAGTRTAAQAAMAVEAARRLIDALSGEAVLCFTDGACKGNPGPAGSGAAVWLPSGERGEAAKSLGRATNNVAELTAIELALELLDERKVPATAKGAIFTDSAYAHGVLARGWKAKANAQLVERVRSMLEARPDLELHWIAGHVGIEGNERADALANEGVAGVTSRRWSTG